MALDVEDSAGSDRSETPMNARSEELWQELSNLADSFADAGRRLLNASRRFRSPGVLPAEELIREVEALRGAFTSVRDRVSALARDVGVELPAPSAVESLKGLAALLEQTSAAEARLEARAAVARRAVGLLDRVIGLRHAVLADFPPLTACQDSARSLRAAILEGRSGPLDDQVDGLAEMDHPFAYLMTLVDGCEVVGDELWNGLFEAVSSAFGKPLAAAVARARVLAGPSELANRPEPAAAVALEAVDQPALESLPEDFYVEESGARDTAPLESTAAPDELLTSVMLEARAVPPRGISAFLPHRRFGRLVRRKSVPKMERLETVRLMSGQVISGHVFLDANDDGLFQPGEAPIAGNTIELHNASNTVVGIAVTDSSGAYSFSTDATVSTAPKTIAQTITVPSTPTNFTKPISLQQFDPSLGTLTAVDITVDGTLTADIEAENTSVTSPSTITATVAGTLTVTAPGVNLVAPLSSSAGVFHATTFDGKLDFAGTSGFDFGSQSASMSQSLGFTKPADLASFVGSGSLAGSVIATENSTASGGGNLQSTSTATATATIRVVYTYTPSNSLAPGNYTIVQPTEPPGTLNGFDSRNGTVLPPNLGPGPDTIAVTLGNADLPANDFGELKPASLSGYVYYDKNDDGVKESGEPGIPGTKITLSGTDDLHHAISQSLNTDENGAYAFKSLRPGTYQIDETDPAGYLDGKDTIGTPGGLTSSDRFSGIVLDQGVNGTDNNFAALLPATVSGFVYVDLNKDGLKEPGEPGLAKVPISLTGVHLDGSPAAHLTTTTDSSGAYSFTGLLPGTYTATETSQPAGYGDGQDTRGNKTPLPNSIGTDFIPGIKVSAGGTAADNDFGELKPGSPGGGGNGGSDAIVTEVDRLGIHDQPTRFVLKFSDTLNPASATDLAHYKLVVVFRDGRIGTRAIPLRFAIYDAAVKTVTLWPVHQLNIHFYYQLTVTGVIDSSGNALDGDANGQPGGDFVTVITKRNYHHSVPSGPSSHIQKVVAWASRFPRLAAGRGDRS